MDFATVVIGMLLALAIGGAGYWYGTIRHASGRSADPQRRRLEEYDFYPFVVNPQGHVEFSSDAFNRAVEHLLDDRNERAARELVVIGEQNLVRDTFPSDRLQRYMEFYAAYDGDAVVSDNDIYLENYKRIVRQIGRSFRNTGIEILLHNLVNPSRSLVAIENGAVTGRSVGSGATNLVLDLKTRRQRGEDKVNYELKIGSRQFKCTTIPIFRPEFGLVGAVCINVDIHFIRDHVMTDAARLEAFVDNLLRTDFQLDENILSQDEYQSALRGKRHYLDEAIRAREAPSHAHKLAAILFSDIIGFTVLMGNDEAAALRIVEANDRIHESAFSKHGGRLLKKLGDGILAIFDSVSGAVASAQEIQRAVGEDARFEVRIGVHLGEVAHADGDVMGDGVNIASRIEGEMGPGDIGISKVVYDNMRNKDGFSATLMGERSLKNVGRPIVLYSMDV